MGDVTGGYYVTTGAAQTFTLNLQSYKSLTLTLYNNTGGVANLTMRGYIGAIAPASLSLFPFANAVPCANGVIFGWQFGSEYAVQNVAGAVGGGVATPFMPHILIIDAAGTGWGIAWRATK